MTTQFMHTACNLVIKMISLLCWYYIQDHFEGWIWLGKNLVHQVIIIKWSHKAYNDINKLSTQKWEKFCFIFCCEPRLLHTHMGPALLLFLSLPLLGGHLVVRTSGCVCVDNCNKINQFHWLSVKTLSVHRGRTRLWWNS